MDLSDVFENTAFWILTAVGEGAFFLMLIVLKKMGNSEIMPLWVKLVTILIVPVVALLLSGYATGGD